MSLLRKRVEPALADPTLLLAFEGWNDAGEAASLATAYASGQLGLTALADIDPDGFYDWTVHRPRVRNDEGGERTIEWPTTSFRFGSVGDGRDLVVGVGAEPHLRWRAFCDLVVGYAKELSIERVVLLGAYLADVVYSRPVGVTGFATRPEWLRELSVTTSQYEGPTGIVGVLGERFREEGLDVLSLWAGLPHYISATPNLRGALALVQKLVTCMELKLDLEPLRLEAAEFEQHTNDLVAADPELSEYVRQLKRREFAQ